MVAAPAGKAAGLLEGLAPWAAHELAAMEYASVGIVTLAFPPRALAGLTGSGLLVPTVEGGGAVKAVTYSSRKWRHLAGHDVAIVRASVGRHRRGAGAAPGRRPSWSGSCSASSPRWRASGRRRWRTG